MEAEPIYQLTKEQVFQAERHRVTGNLVKAMRATGVVLGMSPDDFDSLPEEQKKLVLMALGIYILSNISQAKSSLEAPTVAHYLGNAKKGISFCEEDPQIKQMAVEMENDTEGNPYEFKVEMIGWKANYLVTLSALTGDPSLLNTAVEMLDEAVKIANEMTVKTLLEFQRDLLRARLSKDEESFNNLRNSYNQSLRASKDANRWERLATIASRYAIASLASWHVVDFCRAFAECLNSAFKDRSTARILPKSTLKALVESLLHRNWRRTVPFDADYSSLKL
ncbi:MAG: hypothetical protein NZM26_03715 [Patescibacteria group bacterium]|nr:hypothetical protein [Patescibacteria group bacterium]